MEFILKNKYTLMVLGFLLLLGIIASVLINDILFYEGFGISFGNRIDGIEKYNINDNSVKQKAEAFAKEKSLSKISSNVNGKLISFVINAEDMKIDEAKELSELILEKFSEEELSFFDIQVFLTGEDEEVYPKIGYKHESSTSLIWSN